MSVACSYNRNSIVLEESISFSSFNSHFHFSLKKTTIMADRQEYIVTWFIENYSFCYHKNGERLCSPKFSADALGHTIWCLQVCPRGHRYEDKGYISVFLRRSVDDIGPENLPLKYQLSLLGTDSSLLLSKGPIDFKFRSESGHGFPRLLEREVVLQLQKAKFLPQDILTIRCNLWKEEGPFQKSTNIFARTRIGIEQWSFINEIENFSTYQPNAKKNREILSSSLKDCSLTSCLYFSDCLYCREKLVVETKLGNTNHILSKCEFSLLDTSGALIKCGVQDYRFDNMRKDISKFCLSLTRDDILKRKSQYLPNDKLSLFCDCILSTGVEYEKIERTLHEIPPVTLNKIIKKDHNESDNEVSEKLSACSNAMDDFKSLYSNQLLTDVRLKTKTETFSAHKAILCARSPVFKRMLTNDMKEKITDCIQIVDLEDDIIEKLLLFLYSDNLEKPLWDSAVKLYYAADKYEIGRLKILCSSFLVNNLNASNAGELLYLADTHSDSDMKKIVVDFICKNEKEVYKSREWESLSKTNPQLVFEIMLLKYKT